VQADISDQAKIWNLTVIAVANELDINKLIIEILDEHCNDENVKKLIDQSLRYELDIWNRQIRSNDIENHYELIVDKIVKGMLK